MARRPEHALPAAETYGEKEAITYARSTRLSDVQTELAARCVELLGLQETPSLLLDIGCGTGFSTAVARAAGHIVVGTDLSGEMLAQTRPDSNDDEDSEDDEENDNMDQGDTNGNGNSTSKSNSADFMRSDAGEGVPFRMGTFDGAISVSAIQWLCSAASADQHPIRRLRKFFSTLYAALRQRSRAVLQFYPDSPKQLEIISAAATRAGFSGGLLIDYPESTRAKKYYLVLTAGPPAPGSVAPTARGTADDENQRNVANAPRRRFKNSKNLPSRKDRVIEKKDRRRRQGHQTHKDSKYTGRKRRHKF